MTGTAQNHTPLPVRLHVLALLALFTAVMLVYGRTLAYDFVYDDFLTIRNNPHVQSLAKPWAFFSDPRTTAPEGPLSREIYRPLKSLTVAIDHALYGLWPGGFHLTNLLLHALASMLLFGRLHDRGIGIESCLWGSLVFAVHPALVENVAYISARADILAAIFILLTLKHVFPPTGRTPSVMRGVFFFFLACLSKETCVLFPVFHTLLLHFRKQSFKPTTAFWLTALVYWIARYSMTGATAQTTYYQESFFLTQAVMVKVYLRYLLGFIWPLDLTILATVYPEATWWNLKSLGALLVLLTTLIVVLRHARKNPLAAAGFFWGVLFFLPVANFIPIKIFMAWRFVYVPWMGWVLATAALRDRFSSQRWMGPLSGIWLFLLAVYTFLGAAQFQNTRTLWEPLLDRTPTLAKPYMILGQEALQSQDFERGRVIYERGLLHIPRDPYLKLGLAETSLLQGNKEEATRLLSHLPRGERSPLDEFARRTFYRMALHLEYPEWVHEDAMDRDPHSEDSFLLFFRARAAFILGRDDTAYNLCRLLLSRSLPPVYQSETAKMLAVLHREKQLPPSSSKIN